MKPQAVGLLGATGCACCGARGAGLCAGCRTHLSRSPQVARVPGVERTLAPWDYSGTARTLVLALKLGGKRWAAESLADGMSAEALVEGLEGSVITWVPGRRSDIRARGYDHAKVLAEETGRRLGLQVIRLLRRAGPRRSDQAALGRADRLANLEGAFSARPSPAAVVIVDDLVTTGATGAACGEALRNAGARTVELVAACYVPSSQDAR